MAKVKWCNLDKYNVVIQTRLRPTKNIIVVDDIDDKTYDKAKTVCENICGNLYFPSFKWETVKLGVILDKCHNRSVGRVWIRIFYNKTAEIWQDIDNKENLTFTNFHPSDLKRNGTEPHATIGSTYEWWSHTSTHVPLFPYVLCEHT